MSGQRGAEERTMNTRATVAQVLVEVPSRQVDKTFDYLIPSSLAETVRVGSRVVVPFGPRKVQGFVLRIGPQQIMAKSEEKVIQLKEVLTVLDPIPPLTEELIELGKWMSKKYICLLITAIQAMMPSVLKSKTIKTVEYEENGDRKVRYEVVDKVTEKTIPFVQPTCDSESLQDYLVQLSKRKKKQREIVQYFVAKPDKIELKQLLQQCQTTRSTVQALVEDNILCLSDEKVNRDPYSEHVFEQTEALPLTDKQQQVYHKITKSIAANEHRTMLLHGVTGSGKTEVYMQSIAFVLEQGKEAIVLVPEIALTPQMVNRFKGRFGDQVAVIHSRLSAGERYDEWLKINEGKVKVVIGARSALFAPFTNIGLIIIDEEHESSYKQDESPKYHARDVAIFRGQYHDAPVILGSATPVLESYARAKKGVYELLPLTERVHGKSLPPVTVVDMRDELQQGNRTMFSSPLYEAITQRLQRKEQIVLFLNRRGFSTFVMCRDCGYVLQCPHCDISLTYHKVNETFRCHYCGHTEQQLQQCPDCHSEHIRFFGTGTQKVEEELHKHFPGIRVIRMDVDTTQRKGSHEKLLDAFGQGEADCLLGTQMIAKGLDFEKVTLVGVLAADSMLHLPDFRAAEKTFQLLTQVSGRAGRHELAGEVIVQSYTPDHYSIQCAAEHDYYRFYNQEMTHRYKHGYPPFYYLCLLTFSHEDLPFLVKITDRSSKWLTKHLSDSAQILGPVASPIPRINDRYRYQCMIKYKDEPNLSTLLNELLDRLQPTIQKQQLQVQIDMQPYMMM